MPSRYRHHTIKPAQGGALINVASWDNVGAENYVAKVNMRRLLTLSLGIALP